MNMLRTLLPIVLVLAITDRMPAQPSADPLRMVPVDGDAIISLRIASIWGSPEAQPLVEALQAESKTLTALKTKLGLEPTDIERITLIFPAMLPKLTAPCVLVTTRKPYPRQTLLKGLNARSFQQMRAAFNGADDRIDRMPRDSGQATIFFIDSSREECLLLIDERNFAYLPLMDDASMSVTAFTMQLLRQRKNGPLSPALQAAEQADITIGVNLPSLTRDLPKPIPAEARPLQPFLESTSATITLKMSPRNNLRVDLSFADEIGAQRARKGFSAAQELVQEQLGVIRKRIGAQSRDANWAKLVEQMTAMLTDPTVELNDTTLTIRSNVDSRLVVEAIAKTGVDWLRVGAGRSQAMNHFKQIGLGIHNFESAFGVLPMTAAPFNGGKHPVSWRVQLLPYLEYDNLFRKYRFDEPWDSENNKALIPLMPKVYELPNQPAPEKGQTYIQALTGNGAFFERMNRTSFIQITDGLSNTFMIAEAAEPVIWTKPDDIVFDPKKLPKLGGHYGQGFLVVMGDGSVRFVRDSMPPDVLRAFITRNGGEVVTSPD